MYIYNIYTVYIYIYIYITCTYTYIATCTVHAYIRIYIYTYVAPETLLFQYYNCVTACSVQVGLGTLKQLHPASPPRLQYCNAEPIYRMVYITRDFSFSTGQEAWNHMKVSITLGPHVFLLCCELLSESLSLSEVILPLLSNRANSSVI